MNAQPIRIDKLGAILLVWRRLTAKPQTASEIAKGEGICVATARRYLKSLEATRGARSMRFQGDQRVYWVKA